MILSQVRQSKSIPLFSRYHGEPGHYFIRKCVDDSGNVFFLFTLTAPLSYNNVRYFYIPKEVIKYKTVDLEYSKKLKKLNDEGGGNNEWIKKYLLSTKTVNDPVRSLVYLFSSKGIDYEACIRILSLFARDVSISRNRNQNFISINKNNTLFCSRLRLS